MNLPFMSIKKFGSDDGRYWVRLGRLRPDDEGVMVRPIRLVVQVCPRPRNHFGVCYSRDEDHTASVHLGASIYVSWDNRMPHDRHDRQWQAQLCDDHLSLKWACDDSEMRYDGRGGHGKPLAGWCRSWFASDLLLGSRDFAREILAEGTTTLRMPEGTYACKYAIERCTWTRPRWPWWPFTRTRERAEIDFDPPVGIPGKGENAYDCDDDATYSLSTSLKGGDIRATLEEFALDTLRTRMQRGGLDWRPTKGWPEEVAAD